jgi:carboxypeptidase Q
MIARIKVEGFQHSRALETAVGLSDLNGPRPAGSRGYRSAAEWARDRLAGWGLANAALESWGLHARGWELDRFSVEMLEPYYLRITAFPRRWSEPTTQALSGRPVHVRSLADSDFARYRGRLKGAILLLGSADSLPGRFAPLAHRLTDAELDSLARVISPGAPKDYWEDYDGFARSLESRQRLLRFLTDEGVAAVLEPSDTPEALRADGYWDYTTERPGGPPAFLIATDHFRRLTRLLDAGRPVRLELSLQARFTPPDSGYNVVAELPGSDPKLRQQVVMLGGHLDSWAAGTGATDDGAGCAIVMEAVRILRAIGARPRRTIRVALWDGEEPSEVYAGSVGYVRRHFGDPATMRLKPEHSLLSAYYNVDNGAGRIRGIFLQGNEAARPILQAWLEPFRYLGAATVTAANTGSTDHIAFTGVGLPGFEVLQDPLDYDTRTHHTNLDVADYLIEDDLKQAAVVVASLVYHTAMRAEPMPRPPLPEAHH